MGELIGVETASILENAASNPDAPRACVVETLEPPHSRGHALRIQLLAFSRDDERA